MYTFINARISRKKRFVEAVKVVRANAHWIPPYGTGGSCHSSINDWGRRHNRVSPAPEYIFTIFVMPVGAYFRWFNTNYSYVVSEYDRAAPVGTGAAKLEETMLLAYYW